VKELHAMCARCPHETMERLCRKKDGKDLPACPTSHKTELLKKSLDEYQGDVLEFAKQASIQEGSGYGNKELGYEHIRAIKTRIEETIEFAERMGYKRLGLVFCTGLQEEARIVERLFTGKGFDMVSVICKAGRVPKETIGIRDDEKVAPGTEESICNPVFQAFVLNDAETEFNIMLGLCVGHDSLFMKYSDAPCTVLAVKDRVTGHNPLAALYTLNSYYRALKGKPSSLK
ncbi:MAG: DUF1847 domain-containing protein, partial [Methanogenium sp.]|nr:DUF1847 domain-containing protein [Methanogenium sp.]